MTGQQLADAFSPKDTLPIDLRTWVGLSAGDEVFVEYSGCSAPDPTPAVVVQPVPNPINELSIVPPTPGDTDLIVNGALADARVVALVDGKIRAVRTAADPTVILSLGLTLTERQSVWAYQRLCGVTGNRDGAIPVRRAKITAVCVPSDAIVGEAQAFRVTATRQDTGQDVEGLPVVLDGKYVGVTGSNFVLAPTAGGALAGVVQGNPRYTDAPFSISATVPPPPAPLQLTMQLGGATSHPVSISKIGWRVKPHWGVPPVTVNGTQASASFLNPPGGSPVVSVYINEFAATYSDVSGVYQIVLDAPAPLTNIAFTKPAMHAGFLLIIDSRLVYDGDGVPIGTVPIAMIRWQGTA
ncbi:hypothetical protein [Rhodococcus ruber]|uniref:hypothetical protein n=1 Tax=Rhodococcus ruber TaxID=1830 RepID=UPI0011202A4E|nr:hypothetical protein [Rhodococcus ruber]MDO2380093.1 hypothetical protein [Rhodococcus ruber]QDC17325.1 hypothetical protein E2561_24290 [Rhodococcus ruber]